MLLLSGIVKSGDDDDSEDALSARTMSERAALESRMIDGTRILREGREMGNGDSDEGAPGFFFISWRDVGAQHAARSRID